MKKYWLVTAEVYTPDHYCHHYEKWKLFDGKKAANQYAESLRWNAPNRPEIGTRPYVVSVPVA